MLANFAGHSVVCPCRFAAAVVSLHQDTVDMLVVTLMLLLCAVTYQFKKLNMRLKASSESAGNCSALASTTAGVFSAIVLLHFSTP